MGRLLEYIYKFLLVFSHENKFLLPGISDPGALESGFSFF